MKTNKTKIISDLENVGLKIKGKSPDNKFIIFRDRYGNIRAKLHPPGKITSYDHLHLYDKRGRSLDKDLKR